MYIYILKNIHINLLLYLPFSFIFSPVSVNPIYYVFFTTSTIFASVLLFRGFNTASMVNVVSLFCGFLTIFAGVYLLNTAKNDGLGLMDKPMQTGTGILRPSIAGEGRDSLMRTRDA